MAKSRRAPEDEDVRRRRADDEDDDAPRRRRRRDADEDDGDAPFKPRKKRKSAAGPTKKVIKIIAAVVGAIGLIVLLYWVYSPVGTDHSMLCYFPKETNFLQGYDVDEGLKNAHLQPVHQVLINNYKSWGDRRFADTGVKDTDVVRYLHGRAGDPEQEKDLPPQQRRGELTVVRFRTPVDEAKFVAGFPNGSGFVCHEETAKDGRKFYQLSGKKRVPPDNHEEEEPDVSFFFPNGKTLVYATTRRELTEAMTRAPGKVVLEGPMRELSNEVDGQYFSATAGPAADQIGTYNSIAFGLGFVDEEFRDQRKFNGVVGTASWFASNGNDFLYASANLYGDARTAREVRRKLSDSYTKAQEQIYQSESGKPSGLTDPFNPAQPKGQGPGAGGGGGFSSTSSEQTADIIAALAEYSKTARVRVRGRLVIIEGLIPHGTPEQGIFEKFWQAISSKFQMNQFGAGGFPPGGMGGMPGGMPAPGGMPIGPGR